MNPLREKRAKALAEALADPSREAPVALTPVPKIDGTVATIRLYDAIDSWGGWWGISAKEFTSVLDGLPADTSEIRVLINSPGGEVTEGIAILNALRSHSAKTVAVVEGIAASAASFLAAGCDETVMMRGSEMFIHNAWVIMWGDAADLREEADTLENHFDRNIAEVYADKSGGTVEHWLGEMSKDLWLNADDAVAAGLADRVDGKPTDAAAKARADFGESIFARASRPAAALGDIKPPSSPEPEDHNQETEVAMSDTLKSGLLERLGITDAADLTDDAILASVDEVIEKATEPAPTADVTPPEGTTLIDSGVLADLQSKAEQGAQALAAQSKARRDGIIATALAEGRISPANKAKWETSLEKDEEGAEALLSSLPKNGAVPVDEIGGAGDPEASGEDALYTRIYGDKKGA
jgi:ATP-dependent protease ClpP protease subunit